MCHFEDPLRFPRQSNRTVNLKFAVQYERAGVQLEPRPRAGETLE